MAAAPHHLVEAIQKRAGLDTQISIDRDDEGPAADSDVLASTHVMGVLVVVGRVLATVVLGRDAPPLEREIQKQPPTRRAQRQVQRRLGIAAEVKQQPQRALAPRA